MDMNSSDIFHTPIELKRTELSFCKSSVKGMQDWANGLVINHLGDSARSLFSAILEISELDCKETLRFDLIQTIHPIIENILNSLEKHFFNQSLITSDRNDQIIELALLLRTHFAKIYIDIARRSNHQLTHQKFSLFSLKKKNNLQTARTISSFYALQQLSLLQYQQQMLYSTVLPGHWLVAHTLVECAMRNHYNYTNVNQILGTQHKVVNINQAYAQLILLDIFNTHQIRPAEIQGLYLCSYDWAKRVNIQHKETSSTRYIIDSKKDFSPIYNSSQNGNFHPDIFISTQALLDHLNENQSKKNNNLSVNEKLHLTPALHFHIHNILTHNAERRHERYEYSARIKICFGLHVAHFYLSKGKNFKETLDLGADYQIYKNASISSVIEPDNKSTNVSVTKTIDREAKKTYQVDVLDISVNGYRIKWVGETPKNLKTGEFILVQENKQSPWRGGVIRWIKQSSEKTLELGLEILAQDIATCAVYLQTDRNTGHHHPALLMQTTQLDEVTTSLVLPGIGLLKDKQSVQLRLGTNDVKVLLNKPLLITQSFMSFEFELLNDQQRPILDSFIQKQLSEMKNHDIWEALK